MSKILWYRAADKNSPFGVWKNLCQDMEEEAFILRNSQTGKIRCPVHCEWEDYSVIDEFNIKCSCGKEVHGLLIPWVPEKGLTKKVGYSGREITELGKSWIEYRLYVGCDPLHRVPIRRKVLRQILITLDEHNIKVPYEQLDVHSKKN